MSFSNEKVAAHAEEMEQLIVNISKRPRVAVEPVGEFLRKLGAEFGQNTAWEKALAEVGILEITAASEPTKNITETDWVMIQSFIESKPSVRPVISSSKEGRDDTKEEDGSEWEFVEGSDIVTEVAKSPYAVHARIKQIIKSLEEVWEMLYGRFERRFRADIETQHRACLLEAAENEPDIDHGKIFCIWQFDIAMKDTR